MPEPAPSLLDARILLVDDDPGTIQAHAQLLAGYRQLRFAISGAEALRLVDDWVPELVLLDAEMPGLSGFDVIRALKQDPRLAAVPVIVVTQHGEPRVETAVFELGAADFVTKPAAGPALRARVAMHLRLARATRRLAEQATHDGLTGLAHRRHLDERLAEECARLPRGDRALSLLLADIDHFRAYNETQGAASGDDCLRRLAGVLAKLVQRAGDLAARHGADEFAVLLPDTDARGARRLADHLARDLQALDLPHPASPVCDTVTVSIGLGTWSGGAHAPGRRLGPAEFKAIAENALAAARREGGNRIVSQVRPHAPPPGVPPSQETLT